jgi:hypothetical protein
MLDHFKLRRILLVTFGLAFAASSPATALFDDCPTACPAVPDNFTTGSVPIGVTHSFMVNAATSGNGKPDCATCEACTQGASLIFDGYGTGWCVSVDVNGSGYSVPTTSYARPGKLHADCDGEFCTGVEIKPCGGGSPVYTQIRCLYCGCGEE